MKKIIEAAFNEINFPTLEQTFELLKSVTLKQSNGKYEVVSIQEIEEDLIVVYLEIENENFLLAIYLKKIFPFICVNILIESGYDVYLVATSKYKSYQEILNLTQLKIKASGWSINDVKEKRIMDFTSIKIKPTSETIPDINYQLKCLVDLLLQNKVSIQHLSEITNCRIVIAAWHHIWRVSGFILSKELIQGLAEINIELDYMQYVTAEVD